jgi:hypothetical protein
MMFRRMALAKTIAIKYVSETAVQFVEAPTQQIKRKSQMATARCARVDETHSLPRLSLKTPRRNSYLSGAQTLLGMRYCALRA